MPVNLLTWAGNHVTLTVTVLLGLVLLAWVAEAIDEAEDSLEAAHGVAGRARSGTGGALNVALVSVLALTGWAGTTFQTTGQLAAFLLSQVPQVPVLAASVFTISLGALGLSDLIVLRTWHFIALSVAAVLLGHAYRADLEEVTLR